MMHYWGDFFSTAGAGTTFMLDITDNSGNHFYQRMLAAIAAYTGPKDSPLQIIKYGAADWGGFAYAP